MIISHKHKFIMVMVPRTGSRSMQKSLEGWSDEVAERHHQGLLSLKWDYSDYFTVAFVRNPWDKAISFYEWFKKKGRIYEGAYSLKIDARRWSFSQFVKAIETGLWKRPEDGRMPFAKMHSHGYCRGVQNVYKYEKLPQEWQRLCDDAGFSLVKPLSHIGKSERRNFYKYFESQKMINRVAKVFEKDIELYDYKIPQFKT
jgi:hypothetical protein